MSPSLHNGQLIVLRRRSVIGAMRPAWLTVGAVVVVRHRGLEKVKRISQIDDTKGVFVIGDNPSASADSRTFGWLDWDEIIGRVIWPRV